MPVFAQSGLQRIFQGIRQSQTSMTAMLILLASGLTMSACAAKPPEKIAMADQEPQVISLAYHQPVTSADGVLKLEVTDVTDSRCPVNTRCVWAGQATVSVNVSMSGKAEEKLVIGTSAPPAMNLPGDASYGAYRFSLVSVSPAKASPDAIASEAYKFGIKIVKSGS